MNGLQIKCILLMCLFLTGCYDHAKCIDGELYYNAHPFGADNIYTKRPGNITCVVKD